MGFTKHTGIEEPLSKAKVIANEKIEQAKNLVKEGSQSLIDAIDKTDDEDENQTS
jgi:hypothetical protein